MNIAIVSLHDEKMTDIGEISTPNFAEYGARWNHDVIVHEHSLNALRHPSWSKVSALLEALRTRRYDWAFWIDCDSLFVNHRIPLESKIAEGTQLFRNQQSHTGNPFVQPAIIFASDFNGIACGSLFVRHCEWSLRFLDAVDLCGELMANDPDGHGNKWEQNTIKHLLANFPDLKNQAMALPQQSTNYHYHANDFPVGGFILHFPVLANSERIVAMRKMLNQVIR